MVKEEILEVSEVENDIGNDNDKSRNLILFNDDIHTFNFVIEALIDICKHDFAQAEQCTFLVHYKGKCDVKQGSYKNLKPMREELVKRGLKAQIH